MWKVTAGRANAFVRQFLDQAVVAIGWSEAGDYTKEATKDTLARRLAAIALNDTPKQINVAGSQIWRFLNEMREGDFCRHVRSGRAPLPFGQNHRSSGIPSAGHRAFAGVAAGGLVDVSQSRCAEYLDQEHARRHSDHLQALLRCGRRDWRSAAASRRSRRQQKRP